jgi:hypothetical protein
VQRGVIQIYSDRFSSSNDKNERSASACVIENLDLSPP